jgi:nitrogen fixation protein NifB
VQDGNILYRGQQATELLLARQLKSIERLKRRGVVVKVNYIVVSGINDHHVETTAKFMAEMGVDLFNCMALLPTADTVFADVVEPDKETMARLRATGEKHLPQMPHCKRCRADAEGLLGNDRSGEMAGCQTAGEEKLQQRPLPGHRHRMRLISGKRIPLRHNLLFPATQ